MDFNTTVILEKICLMAWDKFIIKMGLHIKDILKMGFNKVKDITLSLSRASRNFNILVIFFKVSFMALVY